MIPDSPETLIQSLERPDAYPHGVAGIERMETHISWILLTGEFAYKLKKPVNLGFVDFTTLERRRHFCEEELRLNRRLAPELYLDVVPITGTADAPHVGGPGEAIEYAVRMKQFPTDALLSHVLERGELKASHIDSLAAEVANFHAQVEVASADSQFGTPERVHEPIVENFRHLETNENDEQQKLQMQQLREWSDDEYQNRHDDFAARKTAGFVRECHGDLHLGNMILDRDRVVLFDCLEFNESLRWIDVMSEVAFCAMDLADRNRADFSRRFFNAYLERTGDYSGLSVLRYYSVYRALVRAKVARIRAKQEDLDATKRDKLAGECRGYVELAILYSQPTQPWLAITHGFSGSGKTTLTQSIVEQLAAIRIRSDVERKRLFGFAATEHTNETNKIYSDDSSERTYKKLVQLAEQVLSAGYPVIVDATFLKQAQRTTFQDLAEKLHVPFRIVHLRASEAALKQRILERQHHGHDASEADLDVLASQLKSHEPLNSNELDTTIAIDSEAQNAVDELMRSLQALPNRTSHRAAIDSTEKRK